MIESPEAQVRRQIEDALAADPRTRDAVIEVACLGGQVTLSGTVAKPDTKAAAEEIARSASGASLVMNELRIG